LHGRVGQQLLQSGGGEPAGGQLQQHQHRHRQTGAALLTAVGETPGQIDTDRVDIVEHRTQQRCIAIDLRCHHQHIAGLQLRIRRQPLEDAIADELHLTPWAGRGLKQQRRIKRGTLQRLGCGAVHQLLLQLLQQGRRTTGSRRHRRRCSEQIAVTPLSQLHIANPFQQLLEFSSHPPQDRLGARCLLKPDPIWRFLPGTPQLLAPAAAALPEIGAGGQQIDLHLQQTGERLNQLHLHRSEGTDPEQTQSLGQADGIHLPLDQALHGSADLQAEGVSRQLAGEITPEQRLPVLETVIVPPLIQQLRPVEGVVIKGISDGPGQLPAIATETGAEAGTIPTLQPLAQGVGGGMIQHRRQAIQHRPDQAIGAPGVLLLRRQVQQLTNQLPQTAAGKRKTHQGADAVGLGELLPQPTAGGPGVDQHLHRFQRAGLLT